MNILYVRIGGGSGMQEKLVGKSGGMDYAADLRTCVSVTLKEVRCGADHLVQDGSSVRQLIKTLAP
jgi:hypothetical protein